MLRWKKEKIDDSTLDQDASRILPGCAVIHTDTDKDTHTHTHTHAHEHEQEHDQTVSMCTRRSTSRSSDGVSGRKGGVGPPTRAHQPQLSLSLLLPIEERQSRARGGEEQRGSTTQTQLENALLVRRDSKAMLGGHGV